MISLENLSTLMGDLGPKVDSLDEIIKIEDKPEWLFDFDDGTLAVYLEFDEAAAQFFLTADLGTPEEGHSELRAQLMSLNMASAARGAQFFGMDEEDAVITLNQVTSAINVDLPELADLLENFSGSASYWVSQIQNFEPDEPANASTQSNSNDEQIIEIRI